MSVDEIVIGVFLFSAGMTAMWIIDRALFKKGKP